MYVADVESGAAVGKRTVIGRRAVVGRRAALGKYDESQLYGICKHRR